MLEKMAVTPVLASVSSQNITSGHRMHVHIEPNAKLMHVEFYKFESAYPYMYVIISVVLNLF